MEPSLDPYPLPSQVHVASAVTIKLTDRNYLLWKLQLESLLTSQKLLGFVDGREKQPPATISVIAGTTSTEVPNPRYEAWLCSDHLVRSWLFGTLSEEVLGYVVGLSTSQEIWRTLAENFNRSSLARVFELRRNLQLVSKRGKTFTEYCREFRTICDQLSSIGHPVEESMKIFNFLNGLGREYDPVCAVVQHSLSRTPAPTFNDVVSEVAGYDSRLTSYDDSSAVSPHMAFQTQKSEADPPSNYTTTSHNHRGRGSYSNRFGSNRGRGGYSSRGRGFHQQSVSTGQNNHTTSATQRPICQICGRMGHTALRCWNRFDTNYQNDNLPQALAALQVSETSGQEWYPDSGATAHVTSTTAGLNSLTPYNGSETIMAADGNCLPITHVGSANLSVSSGSLPLHDILVCPSVQKPLLSVSKLCEDYPCGVFFDSHKVYILDLETKKVLTKGPRRNGLYVLENQNYKAFYSTRQQATDLLIWHHRLGHASTQVLQHLHNSKAISINKSRRNSLCEPCQMGKSFSLPFSVSGSFTLEPLARIHCDLWGPAPVTSVQSFKFYVVFVDDYSRYSWFYPLKFKSDFFGVFKQFQSLVENQFNKKIKVFQSDGGGEFTSNQFKTHLVECGIKQQISCPHTPQQNGVAERKHRHLIELSLSMLFHSQVPLQYWVESFFTANYLSNLLPAAALNFKTPYQMLHQQEPDYTSLRVFGCACYPCLRPYTAHKFEPRSLQCVFLGYNAAYKGYRCLYPPTGRVYISRHAIFNEDCLPFTEKFKHLVPEYSTPLLKAWQSASFRPKTTQTEPYVPTLTSLSPPATSFQQTSSDILVANGDPGETDDNDATSDPPFETDVAAEQEHEASINVHPMTTRSKAGTFKPNTRYLLHTNPAYPAEPKTISEALKDPRWADSMETEIKDQHALQTWHLVPATPDMNIIGCKWVHRLKLNADGTIDKFKSRLVAKGFHQEEGTDYHETFSPVVRSATIRAVLGVATAKNWSVTQLDVKSAFLYGDLHEDIYMMQPPGFEDPNHPTYVCKLDKAIYGLKQAPRAWFDKFSVFLLEYGFACSSADPSLFVYHRNGITMVLLLYVDDIILTGSNPDQFKFLIEALNTKFSMKDLGTLHYFLGIQVEHHSSGIFLHQEKCKNQLWSGESPCILPSRCH